MAQTLQRKRLLKRVWAGGDDRKKIVRQMTTLLSDIEKKKSPIPLIFGIKQALRPFSAKKRQLLMAWNLYGNRNVNFRFLISNFWNVL